LICFRADGPRQGDTWVVVAGNDSGSSLRPGNVGRRPTAVSDGRGPL